MRQYFPSPTKALIPAVMSSLITDELSVGGENTRDKCARVARRIVIAVKDV